MLTYPLQHIAYVRFEVYDDRITQPIKSK